MAALAVAWSEGNDGSEFFLFTGADHPKWRWRITLKREDLFFLAALWREARDDGPESYAILTTDSAPDLAPLADRQSAVILPRDAAHWLSDRTDLRALIAPLPGGSYEVDELDAGR